MSYASVKYTLEKKTIIKTVIQLSVVVGLFVCFVLFVITCCVIISVLLTAK